MKHETVAILAELTFKVTFIPVFNIVVSRLSITELLQTIIQFTALTKFRFQFNVFFCGGCDCVLFDVRLKAF